MEHLDPILALTSALAAALALGYLSNRLGLSPIVGYLLAGVVVGPYTPGFVADRKLAEQLAEVGVILLMFGVGLHFQIKDLIGVRRLAVPGAVVQIGVAAALGFGAAMALGYSWQAAVVFGLALSVASTVVLTRILADHNDLHTPAGSAAVGWLIVQDLITVLVLVVLPGFVGAAGASMGDMLVAVGLAVVKIALLIVLVGFAGGRFIPWLLRHVAATRSRELFTLTVLVVALGIAAASATGFGVSMALGAFLAGMVVGRSDFSVRAATEALPMRDAFAVLFFVSAGMMFDPRTVLDYPWTVLAALGVILLGTPLTVLTVVLLLGYPVRLAIALALSLTQIGEFSFILTALGRQLRVLPDELAQAVVVAALVSISLYPLVYRLADPAAAWVARRPRLLRWLRSLGRHRPAAATPTHPPPPDPMRRAVIVGYGPVGRTLTRLLRENDIEPTVIEMNIDTLHHLRSEGVPAVYGDANHTETLKAAGVDHAGTLILSASSIPTAEEVIRKARELNPMIRVIVRSAYLRERGALRKAGADTVFAGEGEVALAMTEAILTALGATPEQIDRERDRLRADLLGEGQVGEARKR
jgi:CPA2 family monovalent cation:H+ antiporter-2